MPSSRTNSPTGRDELLLALEPGVGRRRGLEQALRRAIREGRVPVGERLPPTRVLARDLGVSRGTVVEAYEQLIAEGYLSARQGSGTAVARAGVAPSPPEPAAVAEPQPRFSFHPGVPDPTAFPADQWVRALRRALRGVRPERLGYEDPHGTPELRYVLASYLARARGVVSSPELIVTCSGFVRGLGLVCAALHDLGARRLAIENPTIPLHREVAAAAGLDLVPLEVDDHGARIDQLEASRADAVLVTPAHQFPLGSTLSPERRSGLVEWARHTGGFVIEDDYDGEFRYDRQPVGALQALDPEHVVYAGTASKTLAPGLRLGWLALPPALVGPVAAVKHLGERQLPFTDELALAELIESGDWDRHLRRMRGRFRTRRDRLIEMLERLVPEARALGISAGLHAVVELPAGGPGEDELLARAHERSVEMFGLGRFWHEPGPRPTALVVGYGSPPEHRFAAALRALGDVLAV
ncbi:MAG TPA: PLP-dependent aminotransferase family protein [Thermoleophilaceae bacterium]